MLFRPTNTEKEKKKRPEENSRPRSLFFFLDEEKKLREKIKSESLWCPTSVHYVERAHLVVHVHYKSSGVRARKKNLKSREKIENWKSEADWSWKPVLKGKNNRNHVGWTVGSRCPSCTGGRNKRWDQSKTERMPRYYHATGQSKKKFSNFVLKFLRFFLGLMVGSLLLAPTVLNWRDIGNCTYGCIGCINYIGKSTKRKTCLSLGKSKREREGG